MTPKSPAPHRAIHKRSLLMSTRVLGLHTRGVNILVLLMGCIAMASVLEPPADADSARWNWPVHPASVVRGFDPPTERWHAGHRGIDIAARVGASVRSIGPGTVSFAGSVGGKPVVVVTHGALRSTYEPVEAVTDVGDRVLAGQIIGTVVAGHCPGGCLHLGLRRGDRYLDPRALLTSARLVPGSPARG